MSQKIYGESYMVLSGIKNDELGVRYEAGDGPVVLDRPWNVTWLLERGAIEPVEGNDLEVEDIPFSEEPEVEV